MNNYCNIVNSPRPHSQREMRGSITFKIVPSYRSQSMSCEVGNEAYDDKCLNVKVLTPLPSTERVTKSVPAVTSKRSRQRH